MEKAEANKILNKLHFLQSIGIDSLYLPSEVKEELLNLPSGEIAPVSQVKEKLNTPVSEMSVGKEADYRKTDRDKHQENKRLSNEEKKERFLKESNEDQRRKELSKMEEESAAKEPIRDHIKPDWEDKNTLPSLHSAIKDCLACQLGYTRNEFVFGEGNPDASILFVGEAPGADEDKHGRPFIGRAGQLLTKIINAIGFEREEVFIANVIKCRPPANRRPEKEEVKECIPYLKKQIDLIKPDFMVALGLTAAESLTGNKYRMKDVRGQLLDFNGTPLLITYHPAALLRNPHWKKDVWEDMQLLLSLYNEKHPEDTRQPAQKKAN